MTLSLKSACSKDPVDPPFKSPKQIDLVQFTGARQTNHLHIGGIGKLITPARSAAAKAQ